MQKSQTSMSTARVYANVNKQRQRNYWDYDNFSPQWNSPESYEVIRRLGRGKYSEVFEGIDTNTNKSCVVKILKPIKKKKIRREVLILTNLKGGPNIIELYDTVLDEQSRTHSLIFEYVNCPDFKILYPTFSDYDVRFYMYQLLVGLDYAHSMGIMHRDIKPHNVVIDPISKKLRILDWGLAEFYHPNTEYHVRVASRYFKGPELLVNMKDYDYSLDIWSFGCVLAGMIFIVHPFFHGRDNVDQLTKIAKIVGSKAIWDYIHLYEIKDIDQQTMRAIGEYPAVSFKKFVTNQNEHLVNSLALDLLSKVLVIDHNKRLTARECLNHSYFDLVREECEKLLQEQMIEKKLIAKERASVNISSISGNSNNNNNSTNNSIGSQQDGNKNGSIVSGSISLIGDHDDHLGESVMME
jgi:casein kinase II subunit alpha